MQSSRKARTRTRFSRDLTASASKPGVSGSEEEAEEASEVAGPREEALTSLHLVAELSEAEAVEAEDSQLSVQAATNSTGGRLRSWSLGSRPGKRRR